MCGTYLATSQTCTGGTDAPPVFSRVARPGDANPAVLYYLNVGFGRWFLISGDNQCTGWGSLYTAAPLPSANLSLIDSVRWTDPAVSVACGISNKNPSPPSPPPSPWPPGRPGSLGTSGEVPCGSPGVDLVWIKGCMMNDQTTYPLCGVWVKTQDTCSGGTPVFRPTFNNTNGVALTWSSNLFRWLVNSGGEFCTDYFYFTKVYTINNLTGTTADRAMSVLDAPSTKWADPYVSVTCGRSIPPSPPPPSPPSPPWPPYGMSVSTSMSCGSPGVNVIELRVRSCRPSPQPSPPTDLRAAALARGPRGAQRTSAA